MAQIEVKNLTYVYENGLDNAKNAVDNVNLSVENGAFICLIGHRG